MSEDVKCPICNLRKPFDIMGKNIKGEEIFVFHIDDRDEKCPGSYKSLREAREFNRREDEMAN